MTAPPSNSKPATSIRALLMVLGVASLFFEANAVIDGGSTGSRLHIFEFVRGDDVDSIEGTQFDLGTSCIRRGSSKAYTPMSAFGRVGLNPPPLNSTHVASHLLPLFEYAATVVPAQYHGSTPVKYQATAGMRLLELDEQYAVYDALYEGLIESDTFVFPLERSDIATLGGDLEGFYGAVAANYLKGVIDTKLRMKPILKQDSDSLASDTTSAEPQQDDASQHGHGPLGALDMGGSSTQIVFLPSSGGAKSADEAQTCDSYLVNETERMDSSCGESGQDNAIPSQLNGADFFSTSYLSYGVDQFRERLWDLWVSDAQEEAGGDTRSCVSKMFPNPCSFKGYEIEWKGFTFVGTGDAHECSEQVRRLIPHYEEDAEFDASLGEKVGGIEHPPVRGKFFAMSLYYFTLDSLRVLSHPAEDAHEALNLSWPTPSIEELHNALEGLCSRSWQGDLEDIQHDAHTYTRAEVLPHRCIESVYMVTLLRDGFGFDSSSRDITFTFEVEGSEVEWSLGMALVEFAQDDESTVSVSPMNENENNNEDSSFSLDDAFWVHEKQVSQRNNESEVDHFRTNNDDENSPFIVKMAESILVLWSKSVALDLV
eukprot:scaffold39726_cov45-Attheya_sp.AAC.1